MGNFLTEKSNTSDLDFTFTFNVILLEFKVQSSMFKVRNALKR